MSLRTLERIDVLSLATVLGMIGLLWGIVLTIAWLVAGSLAGPLRGGSEVLVSTLGGLISGFIAGGITAILYNTAASLIGGLELELSDSP